MEAEECIRVLVRLRPLNDDEKIGDRRVSLTALPDGVSLHIDEPNCQPVRGNISSGKVFKFDGVIPADEDGGRSQNSLHDMQISPLVDRFIAGYNTTVMAYGQTGSGKTFTMCCMEEHRRGVIPRVLVDVFSRIGSLKEHSIHVTYVEVHNETLRDILPNKCILAGQPEEELQIREDSEGGIHLHGISPTAVHSIDTALSLLQQGNRSRATGATEMNQKSSRSHAIFTIYLTSSSACRVSKFHLVDLAGSERNKRTKNTGTRLKESVGINSGLLALGNVICALSKRPAQLHVPYRDSKLTRLLQDSLGGSCRTTFIACVSPALINHDETLGTLTYAYRARSILNTPTLPAKQLLEQLRREQQIVYFGTSARKGHHKDPTTQENITTCGSDCKALRDELEDIRQCYSTQKIKNRELESELKLLFNNNTSPSCRQCEVKTVRMRDLERELAFSRDCNQNDVRIRELEEELEADEGIFAEYLKDARSLEKINKRQQQRIDELIAEQRGGFLSNSSEKDHHIRQLENRIESLLQQISDSRTTPHIVSEHEQHIRRLEERVSELMLQQQQQIDFGRVSESDDHMRRLECRIEELLPVKQQLGYLQQELEESNLQLTEKSNFIHHLEDRIRELQSGNVNQVEREHKIEKLENRMTDVLQANEGYKRLLQQIEDSSQQLSESDRQMVLRPVHQQSTSQPFDTIVTLQQKIDQLQIHIEGQQYQCDQLSEEVRRRDDVISKQNSRLAETSPREQQLEQLKIEIMKRDDVVSQQQLRIDELLTRGKSHFLSDTEGDEVIVERLKRGVGEQRQVIAQHGQVHPADVAAESDCVLTGLKSHDIGTSTDILPIRSRSPERDAPNADNAGFETTIRTAELQSLRERDAALEQLAKDNYYYQRTNRKLKSKLREVANQNIELGEKLSVAEKKVERVAVGKENRTPPFHSTVNTPNAPTCEVVERDIRTLRKATLEEVFAKQRDRITQNQNSAPRSKSDCGTPSFSQWSPKSLVNHTTCYASPPSA